MHKYWTVKFKTTQECIWRKMKPANTEPSLVTFEIRHHSKFLKLKYIIVIKFLTTMKKMYTSFTI